MFKAHTIAIRCLFLTAFLTALPILAWGEDNAPLQIRGSKYMFRDDGPCKGLYATES